MLTGKAVAKILSSGVTEKGRFAEFGAITLGDHHSRRIRIMLPVGSVINVGVVVEVEGVIGGSGRDIALFATAVKKVEPPSHSEDTAAPIVIE